MLLEDRIAQNGLKSCPKCGAVAFGNAACERCREEWPKLGICPVCGGDCSAANPPMAYCPVRDGKKQ